MVVITGTSSGIGRATALYFFEKGEEVSGIDIRPSTIIHPRYTHYVADMTKKEELPDIPDVEVLYANAGVQNSRDDIDVNLKGTMNIVEKYAFQPSIKSVLFSASASARNGYEFPAYCASKAGVVGYMKNVAWRLAKKYQATCNSISFGGVWTDLNKPVTQDPELMKRIMDVTPLKKWTEPEECAKWAYFLTRVNTSCTGQDILVDNGENDLNCTFVWPDQE